MFSGDEYFQTTSPLQGLIAMMVQGTLGTQVKSQYSKSHPSSSCLYSPLQRLIYRKELRPFAPQGRCLGWPL